VAFAFQSVPNPADVQGEERSEYNPASQGGKPDNSPVRLDPGGAWHISGYWRYEPVTSFGNCLYVDRTLGIVTQRISNLPYGEVEALFIVYKGVGAPNLLNNVTSGYGFSPATDQQRKNFGGLRLKFDRDSVGAQFTAPEIQFELREANHNILPGSDGHAPPEAEPVRPVAGHYSSLLACWI
jgi:hypothetical protein